MAAGVSLTNPLAQAHVRIGKYSRPVQASALSTLPKRRGESPEAPVVKISAICTEAEAAAGGTPEKIVAPGVGAGPGDGSFQRGQPKGLVGSGLGRGGKVEIAWFHGICRR